MVILKVNLEATTIAGYNLLIDKMNRNAFSTYQKVLDPAQYPIPVKFYRNFPRPLCEHDAKFRENFSSVVV